MKIQPLETYLPHPPTYTLLPNRVRNSFDEMWVEETLMVNREIWELCLVETAAIDTTFAMLDEMVKHAVQDATQSRDLGLRWEAVAWLWVCCPDIAEQLRSTWPEGMPEGIDLQQKATAYLERYPA